MATPDRPHISESSATRCTERRKVRKGTQSCWACKRRKVRCSFAHGSACEGCRRRGTSCISQELPEVDTSKTQQVDQRLGRVESLVEGLIDRISTKGDEPLRGSGQLPSRQHDLQDQLASLHSGSLQPSGHGLDRDLRQPQPEIPRPLYDTQTGGQFPQLCSELLAAWPEKRVFDIILSLPVDLTACLHGMIFIPHPTAAAEGFSKQNMLQPPPPGCHPVLIARKLLLLGSFIQSIPPETIDSLPNTGISVLDIMSRSVETARRLVNCNDVLTKSIEAVECVAIESMYYNNAGELRRAWLTMRRAMLMGQMMGLHTGRSPPSVAAQDIRPCIQPEYAWLRLVQSDRYLSMMTGLPQGAPDSRFAVDNKTMDECTALERLQRIHCDVGGHILQRNEANINDTSATYEIDKLLRNASMCMQPQWWLTPRLESILGGQIEHHQETIRLMNQLTHYHLLARLHLPYLLRSDEKHQYSKNITMNASREVLARYVTFRRSSTTGSYCRGIDYLLFIASTTLCLAHIDAHRHEQVVNNSHKNDFFINSLPHQRSGDRGLMEQALESVERMARFGTDVISSKVATTLHRLLAIEADAADGGNRYTFACFSDSQQTMECDGKVSDGGNTLVVTIPPFGAIKIERQGPGTSISDADDALLQSLGCEIDTDDWTLQGVDTAFFDSLVQGSDPDHAVAWSMP